ncbi:hypothetical protein ACFFRR_000252 [Megaselia abdita]
MLSCEEHIKYFSKSLVPEIQEKLTGKQVKNYELKPVNQLDGFMSSLYRGEIKTESSKGEVEKFELIVKFMKGDKHFRVSSKSYEQFANEIFIYSKVIPYYDEIIEKSGVKSVSSKNWIADVFVAKFGVFPDLSSDPESILAMENLSPKGYTMGPPLLLDKNHLLRMTKPLAEYHSLSYVLRITKDQKLEQFKNDIIYLPWHEELPTKNLYYSIYKAALDRFLRYFDKISSRFTESEEDLKFVENVNRLRTKYGSCPTKLLETFRNETDEFAAILHGDFNRNNVLFKYPRSDKNSSISSLQTSSSSFPVPEDVKMIDFQELRYGTPALDLSFYMYMNMDPSIRDEFWLELLKYYHETMYKTLSDIVNGLATKITLNSDVDDASTTAAAYRESLTLYSFDNFYENFSKSAFYGVMVCMHFLPWLVGTKEECAKLSHLFESDMHGDEFYQVSLAAGGDEADEKIMEVVRHSSRMGYMDRL